MKNQTDPLPWSHNPVRGASRRSAYLGVPLVGEERPRGYDEILVLTGKRFRLEKSTLGVEIVDGKRRAVTIPAGSTIEVVSGPKDSDGLVNARWEAHTLAVFAVDVEARGVEIAGNRSTT